MRWFNHRIHTHTHSDTKYIKQLSIFVIEINWIIVLPFLLTISWHVSCVCGESVCEIQMSNKITFETIVVGGFWPPYKNTFHCYLFVLLLVGRLNPVSSVIISLFSYSFSYKCYPCMRMPASACLWAKRILTEAFFLLLKQWNFFYYVLVCYYSLTTIDYYSYEYNNVAFLLFLLCW